MYSRRAFLLASATAPLAPLCANAQESCAVFTPTRQRDTTPDDALALLKDGNARFVAGQTINCNLAAQVRATAHGQAPYAVIVGCIDSRVPPELVFDQRIGDVFVARIAGNFVNDDIVGSLEFATKLAGAKAIVVLGHSVCGAIKGGIDGAKLGLLSQMLENFEPAIAAASATVPGDRSSKNHALVQAAAEHNARLAAEKLTSRSPVLRDLVAKGDLTVVAAMHDISTGVVTFL